MLALLSWATLAASSSAHAQSEEYTRLSASGAAASQAGRHEEAYALFEQAHAIFPNARSFRAMGATAFQLRRYRIAIEHYEAALADERRPLTAEQRAQAENELLVARRLVGRVRVSASPGDATLTLDGQPIEPGASHVIDPGDHEIVASRHGHLEERRTIAAAPGVEILAELALQPEPEPRVVAAPDPAAVRAAVAPQATTADIGYLAVGGALLGVGAVGLGAGIGTHAFGQDAIHTWNTSVEQGSCRSDDGRPPTGETEECITLYRRWDDSQPWLYVGYIAGGALAITGVLLLVLAPQVPARSASRATWVCQGGPGDLGVSCGAAF